MIPLTRSRDADRFRKNPREISRGENWISDPDREG